jgi:hypothetical protein
MDLKECISCRIKKRINRFYKSNQYPDGHMSRCKDCYEYTSNRNDLRAWAILDLSQVDQESMDLVYYILEELGYDSKKDIHQQFVDRIKNRYGTELTYNEEPKDEIWEIKQKLNK